MASVDMHDIDLKEFNEVLAACKGDVFMVTPEGDRLNLKSKLCQLVSLSTIFESASTIPEMEIIAHEKEDIDRLISYMING